ncbi:MAG: aspartate aminotransferase family protein [Candidatus Tectomicrobia bacterium]|nr:aspartate aminotransferase family protein [Candidatus Tectomicrobia bacterium]
MGPVGALSRLSLDSLLRAYERATPASRALQERARASLPGGNTRATVYFDPYPVFMARGEGCRVTDVDGTARLDFNNNYTTLLLGHNHPAVAEAVRAQLERGTAFGAPTELEEAVASRLCARLAGVERVRFCSTGTEANMNCLRVARAFTAKPKVAKFLGHFHGSAESVEVSIFPALEEVGDPSRPRSVPSSPGIPEGVVRDVITLPFNDADRVEAIVRARRDELAAVIVEPIAGGGAIVPRDGFLQDLRRICTENDVLLIFDEVMMFRLARGGAQEFFGVRADLTALGKTIGGGLPIGAFGGRADVMGLFDPSGGGPAVRHSGTHSGSPLSLAAGAAALDRMTPELYPRLNALGERLRAGLREVFAEMGVAARVTGAGSVFSVHFTEEEVWDYPAYARADKAALKKMFIGWLLKGVFLTSRGLGCLSAPMTEAEVEEFLQATRDLLARGIP